MNRCELVERRRDFYIRAFLENKERMSPEEWKSWMLYFEKKWEVENANSV